MKEQLNNITRELQEISTKELTKEEQKKNEQLYKTELKRQIKIEIVQEIETQLQQGESIKNIYNYLINNDDTYISNIIENILKYKIVIKRPFKNKENKIEYKFFNNYPFKDFDNIAEDVDNNYYTILKNIYNKYKIKSDINNEEIKEQLYNILYEIFTRYGYNNGKKYIFDDLISKSFINRAADNKEEKNFLSSIYLKTAKEAEKNYILTHPQEKQKQTIKQTTKKQKYKPPFRKTILLGSATYGLIKGIYKASK